MLCSCERGRSSRVARAVVVALAETRQPDRTGPIRLTLTINLSATPHTHPTHHTSQWQVSNRTTSRSFDLPPQAQHALTGPVPLPHLDSLAADMEVDASAPAKRFEVKKWNAVALWAWGEQLPQGISRSGAVMMLTRSLARADIVVDSEPGFVQETTLISELTIAFGHLQTARSAGITSWTSVSPRAKRALTFPRARAD